MTKPCLEHGCERPKFPPSHRCYWHALAAKPIDEQIAASTDRRARHVGEVRARVPEREWPPGERFCAGCQTFAPLFYCRGSRCRACASAAAHKGHVERTYNISHEEYARLLEWQGGRCYVCGQKPKKRRLAVDHDHETGEVRGLLCANDEWGCNMSLRRVLGDLAAARRLLAYVELSPLEQMRQGRPRPAYGAVAKSTGRVSVMSVLRRSESLSQRREGDDWTQDPSWVL